MYKDANVNTAPLFMNDGDTDDCIYTSFYFLETMPMFGESPMESLFCEENVVTPCLCVFFFRQSGACSEN